MPYGCAISIIYYTWSWTKAQIALFKKVNVCSVGLLWGTFLTVFIRIQGLLSCQYNECLVPSWVVRSVQSSLSFSDGLMEYIPWLHWITGFIQWPISLFYSFTDPKGICLDNTDHWDRFTVLQGFNATEQVVRLMID